MPHILFHLSVNDIATKLHVDSMYIMHRRCKRLGGAMINISTGAVLSHLRKVKLNQEKRLIAQLWFKKSCSIITLLFEYSCNISFCGCSIY